MNEFVRLVDHGDYISLQEMQLFCMEINTRAYIRKLVDYGNHYKPVKYDYCMFSKKIFFVMK